jgi:hypothetical protein
MLPYLAAPCSIRVDPQTGTIQARAIFPNTDGTLLPGQFVRVRIRGGAERVGSAAEQAADVLGSRLSRASTGTTGTASNLSSRAGDPVSSMGETISGVGSQVSEALSSTYEGLSSATGRAVELASEAGPSMSRAARTAEHSAYELGRTVQQDLGRLLERQPLMLGAVGLAIGAAMAAAVPTTETEKSIMGEASDAVKEQAKKLASGATAVGQQIVQEVTREAESQGLTPRGAAEAFDTVKEKVKTVAETAREGIKEKSERRDSPRPRPTAPKGQRSG